MRTGQRVVLNAAWIVLKQAMMALLSVAFVGYVARSVGVASWGELQASIAVTTLLSVLAGVGVRGFVAREIAVRPELGARYLGRALGIRGITGTVLLGGAALFALLFHTGESRLLYAIAAMSAFASLMYSTMWLAFEVHERFQYILFVELGSRLFVVATSVIALMLGHGVVAVALAFAAGNVIELWLTYWFLRTRLYRPELDAGLRELFAIAKQSLPIGLLGALATALQQSDRVLLRFWSGEEAVGVYSAAWVLSDNFVLLADTLVAASFAAGMRLFVQDKRAFTELFRTTIKAALVLGLPVAVGTVVVAPDVIALVYGARGFAASADVLRLLACQIAISFTFFASQMPLMASRRERSLAGILLGGLAANTVLNALWIPTHGPVGSAAATLVAYAAMLVASCALSWRWIRLLGAGPLLRIGSAALVMGAAATGARALLGLWGAIGAAVPVYVLGLFAFGGVTAKELLAILRRDGNAAPGEVGADGPGDDRVAVGAGME